MAAPSLLGDQSRKHCLLASALSFVLSSLPPVSKPILGVDFLAANRLLVDPFSRQVLDSETLLPCPHRRATPASPRLSVMSHLRSATSLPLFQQSLVTVQGLQIRSTAFATPLKPLAGQFLQRLAVLIRKNTGLRRRNSARLKKPELSAAPILPGHRHCTWFRSRMDLGARVAIIAGSIWQRYTTGTLSRPSWTYPQG